MKKIIFFGIIGVVFIVSGEYVRERTLFKPIHNAVAGIFMAVGFLIIAILLFKMTKKY